MRVEFNRTGAERKALVKAISEITGADAVYKFMPSCAYEIDYFTVTKDGALEFDDRADSEEIENILDQLADRGFVAEGKEVSEEQEETPQGEDVAFTVAIPIENVGVGNLTNLLDAKGELIKKALGVDDIRIEIGEEKVSFPWFSELPDAETCQAYQNFIAALCKMSKEQKRINSTEKKVSNEKYAFRCFLLRLGFIGEEYKADRKILLKNLSGSSAFKNVAKKEVSDDEISK